MAGKNKGGRPDTFDPEKVDSVLALISGGTQAKKACREIGVPWATFHLWTERPEVSDRYARARISMLECWANEIIEIAGDDSQDFQPDGKGGIKSDNTAVNRARLRVDTLKWLMSKLRPSVYGDKVQQEHSGNITLTPQLNYKPKE